ncbi:efflux RND transporter periplasmic adaptor subunit [Vibrio astriarenae]|uniref:efflux RND transporter periplasmic adaptor subunit n=1 Tax=Vibrio astriarenae TaxID=1481923 RepID=UPI003735CA1D
MNRSTSSLLSVKKTSLALVISASALLLAACNGEQVVEEKALTIRPVVTEYITHLEQGEFFFNGVLSASERADLSFRHSGRVIEILVDEGTEVEAGQLLAQLDSSDAEIMVLAAQTEVDNLQAEHRRAQTLFDRQQSISKSQLDEITMRYKLAQSRLKEAQNHLNYTQLRAPFSGVVSRRMVDAHTMVQANESIVAVHDLSQLEVTIDVPERLMTQARPGAELYATTALLPNHQFHLYVKKFETEPNPISRTYSVTLGLSDLDSAPLLPGMSLRVVAQWQHSDASQFNVPLSAISPDNLGSQYLWVVDDNSRVQKRIVETGSLIGDRIQVISSLNEGEQVVVSGVRSLSQDLEVRPMAKEAL